VHLQPAIRPAAGCPGHGSLGGHALARAPASLGLQVSGDPETAARPSRIGHHRAQTPMAGA